jgi:SAM-dependent methyltransferase
MNKKINLKEHWNKTYQNNPEDKLGWYETDLTPTLKTIDKTGLPKNAAILNVGAGTSNLIDELLKLEFSNVLATDISEISLNKLKIRLGNKQNKVKWIVDDLTNPTQLNKIKPVDLWIDRAVLHFFTETSEQNIYFNLLKSKVKEGGYAIFAEFSLSGAEKCSGLNVQRYSKEMLSEKLGNSFTLVYNFDHIYTMPSGELRPYIYTLFKRVSK